jgi:branched-chain amino acid aminotransferase
VFDFLRTYNGTPFKLREHLLRLERSANAIWLDLSHTLDEIETIIHDTFQRNNLPEANIRIVVTGGVSTDGITPVDKSGLIVLVTPTRTYPVEYYEQGVKVITVEIERYIPGAKTINYIPAIMALEQARTAGAVEALYVDRHQYILEGTMTNFFIFQGNQLITPKDNILPGITRAVVLELAQGRFEIVKRPLTFDDLLRADEAFISASNKEIMPVDHVNNGQIGNGLPGPNTRRLMKDFHEYTWSSQTK